MLFYVFKMKIFLLLFTLIFILSGCNSGPEKIEPVNGNSKVQGNSPTGIFSTPSAPPSATSVNNSGSGGHHHVIAKELLETDKYTYIKVTENGNEFWLATLKGSFKVGEEYVFNGGLLKTNFKSIEHDRVFEELYLVSDLTEASRESHNTEKAKEKVETLKPKVTGAPMGKVTIKEITENPEKFNNQVVMLFGKITKVNPNIMGTNWHHIQDGSADNYDFVVTSSTTVPVGHEIGFEGVITLNKDFGAGYKYEIIMENAKAIN